MNWLADLQNAMHWGNTLRKDLFKSKNIAYLILLAVLTTIIMGFLLFLVDPNIKSAMDGVWSAWVTMTHVGFGDVVPVSFLGRLLAAALILLGLILFSLFTALVSVTLIGRNLDTLGESMLLIEHKDGKIEKEETLILAELAKLHKRMENLEAMLQSGKPGGNIS